MNTLENLLDNGMEIYNAEKMLNTYRAKIGTMNGIYQITDITYNFEQRGRDVTLKCSKCGREIHRIIINKKNKWSELIKSCPCEKEVKQKAKAEKVLQEKKTMFEEMQSRVGMSFGDYEIISLIDLEDKPKYTLKCKECGAIKTVLAKPFTATDYHCTKHYVSKIKYDESYIGRKKNFLTVKAITKNDNGDRMFLCRCDCGKEKLVKPTFWENGTIKSCGCMRDELLKQANYKEDSVAKQRLYHVWGSMKSRCYNPNCEEYSNYGGRGIVICHAWLNYKTFREWAYANGYDENAERGECTIDRIDVNGNYEPSNCRWITMQEQQDNKRSSWIIDGKSQSAKKWCRQYGKTYTRVKNRIENKGMSKKEALEKPIKYNDNSIRIRLSEDMRKSLDEIASERRLSLSELGREAFEAMIRDNRHK